MNVKTIWYPMTAIALGVVVIMFAPGEYGGHPFSQLGWIIAIMGAVTLAITVALIIRDQNVQKAFNSAMGRSSRTNVMYHSDDRDGHLPG